MRALVIVLLTVALAPASAQAASISLGTSEREVAWGDTLRIFGTASDHRGEIVLLADEFPFEGAYVEFKRTGTNHLGNWKSATGNPPPRRNTRYVAEGGGVRSRPATVYVSPRRTIDEERVSRNRVRATIRLEGHPGFTLADPRLYVYLDGRGADRLRRLGGARELRHVGDGRYKATTTIALPASRPSRFSLRYCVRHLARDGYGRPRGLAARCGAASVAR